MKPITFLIRKLDILFGRTYINQQFKRKNSGYNKESIHSLFLNSSMIFFIDKKKKTLLSIPPSPWMEKYGPFTQLSALQTFENYGIDLMIESIEKTLTSIQ